jgi:hypothetical protein
MLGCSSQIYSVCICHDAWVSRTLKNVKPPHLLGGVDAMCSVQDAKNANASQYTWVQESDVLSMCYIFLTITVHITDYHWDRHLYFVITLLSCTDYDSLLPIVAHY